MLVLVALGAMLAGFALTTNARRLQEDNDATVRRPAAGPQSVTLDWRETYGSGAEKLVFSVDGLEVREGGWSASVGVENHSSVPFELGGVRAVSGLSFGLMLMSSGDLEEMERQNRAGTLPAVRRAVRFEPPLRPVLQPGESWSGTISAPGALVADSWVRVVFGPLVSVGSAPEGFEGKVTWISDRTYRIRP